MDVAVQFDDRASFRGSVIKEYLLVARLENDVDQRIAAQKPAGSQNGSDFTEERGQILVAKFFAKEEMEPTLLRWMQRALSRQQSFRFSLNNYTGVPGGNAVYLRVQDPAPFRNIATELKVIDELVRSNGLPAAKLVTHPRLLVATTTNESDFRELMLDYSARQFHAEAGVSELVLLKRNNGGEQAVKVNVFRLQP